jgi:hypothetical protein
MNYYHEFSDWDKNGKYKKHRIHQEYTTDSTTTNPVVLRTEIVANGSCVSVQGQYVVRNNDNTATAANR